MRARASPARTVPPGRGSSRPLVLLSTEPGSSPHAVDSLIHGMVEVDFVLWSLGSNAPRAPQRGVVRSIAQPAWNEPADDAFRLNGPGARRLPSPREIEQAFVPELRAFLETTIDPSGPGERLAGAMLALRDTLRRWEPGAAWRSRGAWEVVRDHLLVRTPHAGGEDVGVVGEPAVAWSSDELPTVGEAVQALSWLGRMLAPLTVEVPWVDLVHATSAGFSSIPGILAKVERGTPLLLAEHGIAPRDQYLILRDMGAPFHLKGLAADVSGAVARTAYRLADRISPVSRHTMRWELAYGAPRGRVAVVHPGLDEESFRPLEVQRSERPTVVQIAPLDREHDPETLLGVADLVRREVPDVLFLHFGAVADPVTWERIRRLRHELGLEETVRFAGVAVDVPRALAQGDVALVTSRSEVLPMGVLEAALCGIAVVATDTGGVREALDGGGIVAPVGDAPALAEAVAATLRITPEQRDRARRGAREQAVHRFGLGRFLVDYRSLYAGLGVVPPESAPAGEEPVVVVPEAVDEAPADEVTVLPEAEPETEGAPAAAGDAPTEPAESGREAEPVEAAPRADVRTRLADPDPLVRAEALGELVDPADVDVVGAALADDAPQVRREAVRALGRLNGPRAGRWLTDTLKADPNPEVRFVAVDSLAALLVRHRPGRPE